MALVIPAKQPADAWGGRFGAVLLRYRELVWEITRLELQSRYGGRALGLLWAIGHPLFLITVYVVVFGFILPARLALPAHQEGAVVVYILAGLIPWIACADLMGRASGVIAQHAPLVKQLIFPVDILPITSVLAACVPQLVMTGLLVLYMALATQALPMTLVLLPALWLLQVMAMAGVCYALSAVGVYVRDVKDIVQMFLSVGLFLAPIVYLPSVLEGFWDPLKLVLMLNPFSHLVWCYQDLLYFGRLAHPTSWIVVGAGSVATLWLGYAVFTRLKAGFGECV